MTFLDAAGRPAAAVLFDCDGLLADTEPLWGAAMEAVLRAHGRRTDDVERLTLELTGASIDRTVERLTEVSGLTDSSREAVEHSLLTAYAEIVAGRGAPAMPGAVALVRRAAAGLPVAVVSNSPRDVVIPVLESLALTRSVSVVVGAHRTCPPKPRPDPYLLACRLLDVAAARCVAFEDSVTGARAAVAAGLAVTAVPPPGTATASYPVACRIVGSLAEVDANPSLTA